MRASFLASDRTYGARRVWHDVLAEGIACGLHQIERLMRTQVLKARPRRRGLPKDEGDRLLAALSPNLLDRQFEAELPNQKWIADFTYVWTTEGWLFDSRSVDRVGFISSSYCTCHLPFIARALGSGRHDELAVSSRDDG